MSQFAIAGYSGLIKSPKKKYDHSSLFMVTDEDRHELNIFILFPGSYMDIIEIASMVHYTNINIFSASLDSFYISDIYRAIMELSLIKKSVSLIFPESIHMQVNTKMHKVLNKSFNFYSDTVTVNYLNSGLYHNNGFYNFKITFNNVTYIFANYLSIEDFNNYMNWNPDEVHIPFSKPLYGGISFLDIMSKNKEFSVYLTPERVNKLRMFGCSSRDELRYVKNTYPNNIPCTKREFLI